MNYRHAFHAGNFADVLKHAALMAILKYLRGKKTPFLIVDTHAGRGLYDLAGPAAQKTAEAQEGIARLRACAGLPPLLADYVATARGFGAGKYPGSPLIAATALRPQDRLLAIEQLPDEAAALITALAGQRNARVIMGDGYAALARLLPPRERRALVLVDPPFETPRDWAAAADALKTGLRKFATGIFCFWYPAKSAGPLGGVIGELLNAGAKKLLRVELDTGERENADGRLTAAGLLIVNTPYGFATAMAAALPTLERELARGAGAQATLDWIAED